MYSWLEMRIIFGMIGWYKRTYTLIDKLQLFSVF